MHLRHISQAALITFAGGDPWKINATLQSGRPAQISDLAQAFHDAGQSTAEADTAFRQARERFEKSWTHETGENPINDSAEVRRTVATLGVQAAQLPKIAADLQNVAATLAEAQRSGKSALAALEDELHRIDDQLDEALQLERDPNLTRVERDLLEEYITGCEQEAIDKTRAAIGDLERIRDD
ncbi:putative alpha/beta hydrolase [Mycobacterium ulcerans]|uniref:putative alpha/beta hydrolase n=1 Tax=Mycobacterium ulcerans TaxID=1809 RepID=UPI0002D6CC2C